MSEVPYSVAPSDYAQRVTRTYRLDKAGAESMRDVLSFKRPPKWESERAELRRMIRLARLREGS